MVRLLQNKERIDIYKGAKESIRDFLSLSEAKIKCNKINKLQPVDGVRFPPPPPTEIILL